MTGGGGAMRAEDFDFQLPDELIAQEPAPRRRDARLLHLPPAGAPLHRSFSELPDLLRAGDVLVCNETRVIPARLSLRRASGGTVEVFLVRPAGDAWRALLRPAKRLRAGERLDGEEGFAVVIEELEEGSARVRLLPPDGISQEEALQRHGLVPLPPYIRRPPRGEDRERYQTVFAREPGAVAAPTAGLHFDDDLLGEIAARGVRLARLVLHVGPGTFRPLPDGALAEHRLDSERFELPAATVTAIREARAGGGRVVAVGTTVVRTLESWARAGEPESLAGETDLFVRPPFGFRVVDALVTNFHLPKSSLLCLVAAFVGRERILAAYREAVCERYRFYSYGDATFLERP